MRGRKGHSLLIAGGVAALVIIAAIAVHSWFDIDNFKSNIQSAVFDATGLEVRFNGKAELSFFPFGLSADDVQVLNRGEEILSLANLKMEAKLLPLLQKQLKVKRCEIGKPAFTITRGVDGKYNFESIDKQPTEGRSDATFSVNDLQMLNGGLVYLDMKTGERIEFRDFNLVLKNLSIPGNRLGNASFTGSFNGKEVLQKNLQIDNLDATLKAVEGVYHFEPLVIGAVTHFAKNSGEKTELQEIHLTIKDLTFRDSAEIFLKNISFTGELACREVRKKALKINNAKSSIKAKNGIFALNPLVMDIFGAQGEGDATIDQSAVQTLYKINLKVSGLDFEKFEESYGLKKVLGGKGDLFATLTMKEQESAKLISGLDGSFSLRGDNLVIYTVDIDKALSSYERSQEFNLVDLGVFFIAGPLSTLAVRAYGYADLYNQTRGGQGTIMHFNSQWKINNGVAEATDCALATRQNRIALIGKLDLVREHYDDVTVALLDDKGCAKFSQSISGSLLKPRISAVSAAESLAGPFSSLYREVKRFVRGGKCAVIYNGSVQQPPD